MTFSVRNSLSHVSAMLLGAVVLSACTGKPPAEMNLSVPVDVVKVEKKSLPEVVAAVGSVEAINSVAVKSLVDGQLLRSAVADGQRVEKGQLLFTIDPRPLQAALAQAQAALARDVSARDLAAAQVKRYRPVSEKGFISADQMQQYVATLESAVASVKVDQANVDAARLKLAYTEIDAPISGLAGRILVQPGNLVKANDTQALLTINQIAPIYVNFAVPGREVDRVRAAQSGNVLGVAVYGDGIDGKIIGKLAFVDNAIDPATNTVKLRAIFANDDKRLWPGQFVNVDLTLGHDADALVVPDSAVKDGPKGSYVFVVKPDGTAEQRDVKVARSLNGLSMISAGLHDGETVVTDGQSRLTQGARVQIAPATR
ncbi:MAG: efflux RND transporter periplasmic adaptor subunit [Rudaea sp.]